MKVYAFDFDGTLTKKDTFLAFIEYAKGYGKTFWGFFLFSPILILMKLRLFPNWKAKQMVFSWFFKGMNINEFNQICHEFADRNQCIIRTRGWDTIRKALANGEQVIIITASIENWVKPFFKEFGNQIKVEGTKIDVRINQITGQFLTQNCYGVEKTKRLKEVFPYRQAYELIAFGDSNGDRYLLNEADESHYKPFRNEKTDKIGEIIRFGIVGVAATAIQYGLYLLLLKWLQPQISNTIGYAISFVFNYIASTKFTFKVKSTAKKGAGFAFSHLINYVLQTVFLTLFLWLGLPKNIALIPVFCICVPINFLLVRLFLKKK
ncbi:HAD phosphoserine phosphatase-like hydrolase, family IB [Prevotella disiens JCM 6334 = ATCC 29426]|uniref:HAD hydrolase, family IB n=2 Tax=Prevotella disiens TaxID=28130 RepID=A0A379E0C1_9BACT|nr:HAD-IB family phosphatase [Prevotella disiens]ERJ78573.1 HAD phosphoserine phosphatase-like hydrolase, family IB [Prevotella disiens JCM 6334 = ATCC 29426]SUB86173.1 HAD hydrolase, family IB [Prevotella disiens]